MAIDRALLMTLGFTPTPLEVSQARGWDGEFWHHDETNFDVYYNLTGAERPAYALNGDTDAPTALLHATVTWMRVRPC